MNARSRRPLVLLLAGLACVAFAASEGRRSLADEGEPGMDGEPAPDQEPGMDGEPAMEGEPGAEGGAGGEEGAAPAAALKPLRFEKLKLTWTIAPTPKAPEGKSLSIGTGNLKLDADPSSSGEIAVAQLEEDGVPACTFFLIIQPEVPGDTASAFVRQDKNFESDATTLFEGAATPQIDDTANVGNWRGALRGMSGKSKQDGKPLVIRQWFAILHGVVFRVRGIGFDRGERTYKEWFQGTLAGLKWDDASEGVRGPLASPFPGYTAVRPDNLEAGKKSTFKSSVLSLEKADRWGRLKYLSSTSGFEPWIFAAETREADAYAFVGILKYPAAAFLEQKKLPESVIDDLETEWRNALDDPVTRGKGDKNKKADQFKGGKGFSYEFKGVKDGVPYVERGSISKQGQLIVHVRVQLGGKNAEKLRPDADKLVSSIKFD